MGGSQLACGEGCQLAEPLLELNCIVNMGSQAGSVDGFTDLSLACETLPGHQVATCRSCDEDAGILPPTCKLLYSFSEAEGSTAKEVASNQEKVVALCLVLLLVILLFMLLRDGGNVEVESIKTKIRLRDGGNVEIESIKTKIRLEKGQLEREKGRVPESGGCRQEKIREMAVDGGNSDGRTAPTFLLEHSMIKERKGRKKAGKHALDRF